VWIHHLVADLEQAVLPYIVGLHATNAGAVCPPA